MDQKQSLYKTEIRRSSVVSKIQIIKPQVNVKAQSKGLSGFNKNGNVVYYQKQNGIQLDLADDFSDGMSAFNESNFDKCGFVSQIQPLKEQLQKTQDQRDKLKQVNVKLTLSNNQFKKMNQKLKLQKDQVSKQYQLLKKNNANSQQNIVLNKLNNNQQNAINPQQKIKDNKNEIQDDKSDLIQLLTKSTEHFRQYKTQSLNIISLHQKLYKKLSQNKPLENGQNKSQQQTESLKIQISQSYSKIKQKDDQIAKLKTSLNQKQKEVQALKIQSTKLNQQIKLIKKQYTGNIQQIATINLEYFYIINKLNSQIGQFKNKGNNSENNSLQKIKFQQKSYYQNLIKNSQIKNKALLQQLLNQQEVKKECDLLKNQLNNIKKAIFQCQQNLQQDKQKKSKVVSQQQKDKNIKEPVLSTVKGLIAKFTRKTQQTDSFKIEVQKYVKMITQIQELFVDFSKNGYKHVELRKDKTISNKIMSEINKISDYIQKLNNQVLEVKQQNNQLKRQIQILKNRGISDSQKYNRLLQQFKHVQQKLSERQDQIKQISQLLTVKTQAKNPIESKNILQTIRQLNSQVGMKLITSTILNGLDQQRISIVAKIQKFTEKTIKRTDILYKMQPTYAKTMSSVIPRKGKSFAFVMIYKTKNKGKIFGSFSLDILKKTFIFSIPLEQETNYSQMKKNQISYYLPKNENVKSIEFGTKMLCYGNNQFQIPIINATSVTADSLPLGDIYFDKIPWKKVLCEDKVDKVELMECQLHKVEFND